MSSKARIEVESFILGVCCPSSSNMEILGWRLQVVQAVP